MVVQVWEADAKMGLTHRDFIEENPCERNEEAWGVGEPLRRAQFWPKVKRRAAGGRVEAPHTAVSSGESSMRLSRKPCPPGRGLPQPPGPSGLLLGREQTWGEWPWHKHRDGLQSSARGLRSSKHTAVQDLRSTCSSPTRHAAWERMSFL